MAGDAILDFQICEISLANSVWKAQTHFSKWPIIKIFSFFQDGDRHHLGLSNPQNFIG